MVLLHPALISCAVLLQTKSGNSWKVWIGPEYFVLGFFKPSGPYSFSMLCFHPYFTWNVVEKTTICWTNNLPQPSALFQQEITAIWSELFSWKQEGPDSEDWVHSKL